jgi:hypothetical protein
MRALQARRQLAFALAVATLALGAIAIGLSGRSEPLPQSSRAPLSGPPRGDWRSRAQGSREGEGREAAQSAARFTRAYLHYEAGALGSSQRRAISRLATPRLAEELLRGPARAPPGSRAPRERLRRIAALRVGLFEGAPALAVRVLIAGRGGTHSLQVTVIKTASGLAVAGIGP